MTRSRTRTQRKAAAARRTAQSPVVDLASENTRLDATVKALAEQLASVTEHAFVVAGHAAGDLARRVARRREMTDQWGVFDDMLGSAQFWGADHTWHPIGSAPCDAMYLWPVEEARRIARMLAGQPALSGDDLGEQAPELSPEDEALVDAHLAEVGEQLAAMVEQAVPAAEVEARLQDALATVAARLGKPMTLAGAAEELAQWFGAKPGTAAEGDTITLPAPADRPDFQPEPPDAPEPEGLLSLMAQGISANAEQPTVALPVGRVQGPAETQPMAVLHIEPSPTKAPPPALPPLPQNPPPFMPLPPITWRGGKPRPLTDNPVVQFAKT